MSGPKIGQVLSRLIVPAWVITGAVFKLQAGTPSNLPPKTILYLGDKLNIDLLVLLATLIGLELMAAIVMVCIARLARPTAIFVLSAFCLIIIGEMVQGNVTSCGCLGDIKLPPWLMLLIDGTLLIGVVAFDPSPLIPASPRRWPVGLALILIAGAFVWSFTTLLPAGGSADNGNGNPPVNGDAQGNLGTNPVSPSDPAVNPIPAPVPNYWFASNTDAWVGKSWKELNLFSYMQRWPSDLDTGTRYIVFYNRTCDHCEEMFVRDFMDPHLASMVTAIEVPDSKTVLTSPNGWPMPMTDAELLSLPLGCDWIMTTPLALRIVDGVVQCAVEGDHRECMELE